MAALLMMGASRSFDFTSIRMRSPCPQMRCPTAPSPAFIEPDGALDQVPVVLAAPRLGQDRSGPAGQPQRVIRFAINERTGIRGDLAAVEFQLQAAVEFDPQRRRYRFTHRARHDRAPNIASSH